MTESNTHNNQNNNNSNNVLPASFLEFLSELPNGGNTNTVTLVNNTNTNTNEIHQCGICYDTTNLLATPCSHFFCKPCLIAQHNSRNRKCALCRTFLPVEFRNTYTSSQSR